MAVRTIAIPVAEVIGASKTEFYGSLRESLNTCVRAANLVYTECASADRERFEKDENGKVQKAPKLYFYKKIAPMFPGRTGVAAGINKDVTSRYVKQFRLGIASGKTSLPNVRSYPLPLLRSMSGVSLVDSEDMIVRIRLLDRDYDVRLKRGSNYRDQIRAVQNAETFRDSKIWIDRNHKAIIGFAIECEPRSRSNLSGTLRVATHKGHLLVAMRERDSVPFAINRDCVKRWESEKESRYRRLRQDRKADKTSKVIANEELRLVSAKYNRRMQQLTHEVSKSIVDYAIRRRVAEVEFDGTVKSYVSKFPWFELAAKIAYKCADAGIAFRDVSMTCSEPDLVRPHVYFRYSPATSKVKIGKTINGKARAKAAATDSPDENLTVIAIQNVSKAKLTSTEKYWHGYFDHCRLHGEWFDAGPVITWLRAAGWIGNAGNLSQIAQVLDMSDIMSAESSVGHLQADGEGPGIARVIAECGISADDCSTYEPAVGSTTTVVGR